MSHETRESTPLVTATVIDPAGPALTTTVRFPGLAGATLVEGVTLVVGTLVVGAKLVVGATLVVGTLVDGVVVVDGDVVVDGAVLVVGLDEVVGVSDVLGDTEATVGSTDVATSEPASGVLADTAAVIPSQTPSAAMAIAIVRRVKLGTSF